MSVEEFIKEIREEHEEDLEEIEKLLRILDQLREADRKVYDVYITSDL
jgi:hypothetical protein